MIHLHVHTDGSVLDGACQIDRLVEKVLEQDENAVGITDHGNMIKVPEFQEKCVKAGIKPIIGCEFYVGEEGTQDTFHLILIAKTQEGLKNLYALNTLAYGQDRFYKEPRIRYADLITHHIGLICTTACLGSQFAKEESLNNLSDLLCAYKAMFGEDFYLELQANGLQKQKEWNRQLIILHETHEIPLIVSCDCHYVNKEDYGSHDTMLCIQVKKKKADTERFSFKTNDFYLKNNHEIFDNLTYLFVDTVYDAINNTQKIANSCNALIEWNQQLLPHLPEITDEVTMLQELCTIGFKKRVSEGAYDGLDMQIVVNRIYYELSIIIQKGYQGYFLIVEDFIKWAKNKGIYVGPGRGSACGSEVAYVLNITEIEPIRNNLFFERMLNPEREAEPDIDSDFCYERREEVIQYMRDKYGVNNVAAIMAQGTLACSSVVRKVLGAYDFDQREINRVAKLIPTGVGMTIDKAFAQSSDFMFFMSTNRNILIDCTNLEGLMSHVSTHAAGIAVSSHPITDYVPCMTDADDRTKLITQWHKKILAHLGLYKFDFLGLRTLTIIRKCIENINKFSLNPYTRDDVMKNIVFDDDVKEILHSGDLCGIFQFDAPAGKQAIMAIKPECYEDVIAGVSICRPGVKEADLYVTNRKLFLETGSYPLSGVNCVDRILKETYGAIVYQEQTMQIMHEMAGWSLGKADSMRKVKDLSLYKDQFVADCAQKGYDILLSNSIWLRFSLKYTFNKSHAAAYAKVAIILCKLKKTHRAEFMAAVMSLEQLKDNNDLEKQIKECKKYEVPIITPNINVSDKDFKVIDIESELSIILPLTMISKVGAKAIDAILELRESNGFISSVSYLWEHTVRGKVKKTAIANLIKAGCFDFISSNRNTLLGLYGTLSNTTYPEYTYSKEVQMYYETEVFGFPISVHPLDGLVNTDISKFVCGSKNKINCVVEDIKTIQDKNNNTMCFIKCGNKVCCFDTVVFSYMYEKYKLLIRPGNKLCITGTYDGSSFVASEIEAI